MTGIEVAPATPASLSETSPGNRRRAWIVTAMLVAFMMVNFADKAVLGLAADPIMADLGLSATQFGLANSAFFLLFSLFGAVGGLLADRVSPRWLLLGMALLWSVSQSPMALGGGVAMLFASRILLGATEGPAFPIAQQTALSWFPNHRRNLPTALITAGTTLGVVIAAPGLTWVVRQYGWRSAFAVVAIVGVLWAVVWAFVGRQGRHAVAAEDATAETTEKPGSSAVGYRRIIATRSWIGVTAGFASTYWILALALVWLPSYLHNGLGYRTTTAANLVALVWAVSAVAVVGQAGLTGWLLRRGVSSRWARARVGGITLILAAAGCLALAGGQRGPLTVLFMVLAFGICGVMASIAVTTVAEFAPPGRRGGALGLMNAVVTVAGLLGPVLIGRLVDTQGLAGYRNSIVLSGVLLLLGGLAACTLVDPDRDRRRLAR
ncbi:sugar phosphate permease [Krasilnikovia cinnamomea]|uniref:Sugar phosphate permease n=1 Tax=Krasilnikovia cinnamomea TaxID=349313 RepID=A0A4Q7ZSC6_9ACTN|nr:MFS transporter [Krasilnikovia cinnamomea]RZU53754.1 sugar phosphate permease [Krasilnikovia cinnamomea]